MLSILITIFNYNLYPLVKQLHKQCKDCGIVFEILTQDDASNSIFNVENEKINKLSNCFFFVLPENVGYRENKNILVLKSKFELLLILDGDCLITNPNYIKDYLINLKDYDGIYGGRIHPKEAPSNNQSLRWKYGKYMEDQSTDKRLQNLYRSFLFNNTLIKKSVFNKIKFDSSFKKYGHDDTLFSYELKKNDAKLYHINNPVLHDDIDSNDVFLKKTKGSLENLLYLYGNNMISKNHSKMITLFIKLKTIKLTGLITLLYDLLEKPIEQNLTGNKPKLFVFNVFRLGYFCKLQNSRNV